MHQPDVLKKEKNEIYLCIYFEEKKLVNNDVVPYTI